MKDNKDVIGSGKITKRQFEAFGLIFTKGLSYTEAAEKMGISQQAVTKLIKKIRKYYPECVPKTEITRQAWKTRVAYNPEIHDSQIREKW